MNLKKVYANKNESHDLNLRRVDSRYVKFQDEGPKGIIVHDCSSGNPALKRWVQPDDGLLGVNPNNNSFNICHPGGKDVGMHAYVANGNVCKICGGVQKSVHAFIGKLENGSIATYQTAPWNYRLWHVGTGTNGTYNDSHIGFEICDDNKYDSKGNLTGWGSTDYFNAVYKEAVEFCAYLCRQYNFNPLSDGVILGHYEAARRGMGSNHGDPQVWFSHFGKSMDTLRAEVNAELNKTVSVETPSPVAPEHWAVPEWNYLNSIGLTVHEQRFDDNITRGEMLSLLARYDKLKR